MISTVIAQLSADSAWKLSVAWTTSSSMSKTSMPISGNLTQVETHLLQKKARQYLMMKDT